MWIANIAVEGLVGYWLWMFYMNLMNNDQMSTTQMEEEIITYNYPKIHVFEVGRAKKIYFIKGEKYNKRQKTNPFKDGINCRPLFTSYQL
jgi:hypothetical protein